LATLLYFYSALNALLHLFSLQVASFYVLQVNFLFVQLWQGALSYVYERLSGDFFLAGFFFNLGFSNLYYFLVAQQASFLFLTMPAEEYLDGEDVLEEWCPDGDAYAEEDFIVFLLYRLSFEDSWGSLID
jgi:hypothetical protein